MICPKCRSAVCRRSRRRGLRDRIASALGFLPWRCATCELRFFARTVALRHLALVHCPQCGNLDLERVARDRVFGGWWTSLRRILRFPAYRCDACRNRFFSLRRFRRIVPTAFPEFSVESVPTPGRRPSSFTEAEASAEVAAPAPDERHAASEDEAQPARADDSAK